MILLLSRKARKTHSLMSAAQKLVLRFIFYTQVKMQMLHQICRCSEREV